MGMAILYARFSDRRESERCQSNQMQLEICRKYCEGRHDIVGVFADAAISGAEEDRPILWEAIDSLKRGMVLVVYRADRLARNVFLHELIYREVARKDATIEIVDGSRNGNSAEDELMRTVLAAFYAYERKVIAARTKAATLRHQANGLAMSKEPPYGKRPGKPNEITRGGQRVKQRTWVDDSTEQTTIAHILELHADGLGLREIARRLTAEGVRPRGARWNHVTIRRIISRQPCPASPASTRSGSTPL